MASEKTALDTTEKAFGTFSERLQNFTLKAIVSISRPLPFAWRGAVSGWFFSGVTSLVPKFGKRIRRNLKLIYPDMAKYQRNALQKRIVFNIGRTLVEVMQSDDLIGQIDHFHVSGPGFEVLRQARAQNRGAIIATGHFGQWETVRISLQEAGMECSFLYRPHNNQEFDASLLAAIRLSGEPIFPRGSRGMRDMIQHLKSGGFVAMMLDQSIKTAPVFQFMGQPAHTTTIAASLALRFDLPLVPAFGVRRSDPAEFDVIFEDPIPKSTPEEMTQAFNDRLEAHVRADPEQWYWVHRRWKIAGKN